MSDENFSVICFRQGTVSGYSPRMRLDLIVNTMFKCAMQDGVITVNNPAIWRPILSIQDAASAYIRAVEANLAISGIFNISSGNYTVGEVADLVKLGVEDAFDREVKLNIKNIQDYRNYKVTTEKARNVLSHKPRHTVESIIHELALNLEKFKDFDNPNYYNIQVFKTLPTVTTMARTA
jgi:nucleoside-diphosphate-sugar epimerase